MAEQEMAKPNNYRIYEYKNAYKKDKPNNKKGQTFPKTFLQESTVAVFLSADTLNVVARQGRVPKAGKVAGEGRRKVQPFEEVFVVVVVDFVVLLNFRVVLRVHPEFEQGDAGPAHVVDGDASHEAVRVRGDLKSDQKSERRKICVSGNSRKSLVEKSSPALGQEPSELVNRKSFLLSYIFVLKKRSFSVEKMKLIDSIFSPN